MARLSNILISEDSGLNILSRCMITRTPNGDLYASSGDLGQNRNLTDEPIRVWYSDDNGATWSLSLGAYVAGWYFGGGDNGVCIASDSTGEVYIAFAVRKTGSNYPEEGEPFSNNRIVYWHGKHGDWGSILQFFGQDHMSVLDALPKVTAIEVDSNDLLHIMFSMAGNEDTYWLHHIWNTGVLIASEYVSFDLFFSNDARLAIDGTDKIHFMYGRDSDSKVYYRNKPSGGSLSAAVWVGMVADPEWMGNAIVVDQNNNVHFATFNRATKKTYYRQRLADGTWTDIEETNSIPSGSIGLQSLSIISDGTVFLAQSWGATGRYLRRRHPVTKVWSTEFYATGGRTVCLLHSFYPLADEQHICMLDSGWMLHHHSSTLDNSYYSAEFISVSAGYIWASDEAGEETELHYVDELGAERAFEGADTGSNGDPGYLWIEGAYIHCIDSNGDERRTEGIKEGAAGVIPGQPWIEGTKLRYIDETGDERYIEGS